MVLVLAVFYLRRYMSSNVLPQLLYHFLKQDVQANPGSYDPRCHQGEKEYG
jgi:hypothetical protein